MLTSGLQARLRAQADRLMTDTVEILRPQTVSDGAGGQTTTWTTIATVSGRVGGSRFPVERLQAEQLTAEMDMEVALPAETDVRVSDRLLVRGITLGVIGVRAPQTIEIERRVVVQRVN